MPNEQEQRLEEVIYWAGQIGNLADLWDPVAQQLHLRPSSRGIRLVDLNPRRPQLDRGWLGDVETLRERFEVLVQDVPEDPPGRPTPEKKLQSALILGAYKRGRVLHRKFDDVRFVTDEQVIMDSGKKKIPDLLAVRDSRSGPVPVLIELKPSRQMKRAEEQLEVASLIDAQADGFSRLYSVLLGEEIHFVGPCERWLIWPAVPGYDEDPRAAELAIRSIKVITYAEKGGIFLLSHGQRGFGQ